MTTALSGMKRGAAVSADGRYRYSLSRTWDPTPETTDPHRPVVWVMLNPSIADDTIDDPTIVRCVNHTRRWGFCSILVVNLFAYRATDPRDLTAAARAGIDVVGPLNDDMLAAAAVGGARLVAAWGAAVWAERRANDVLDVLTRTGESVLCLGRTSGGHPVHPLVRRRVRDLEVFRA